MNNSTDEDYLRIRVSDSENLTSFKFYNYLLPQLHDFFKNKHETHKLILDFFYLEKINPMVIPNLFILGEILKNFFGKPTEISLNWQNKNLLQFLHNFNFFKISEKLELFEFKGEVGGFSVENFGYFQVGNYFYNTFSEHEHENGSPSFIENYLRNKLESSISKFINEDNIKFSFFKSVSELINNSNIWGKSRAYFSAYGGPKLGLNIAISDCGIGYLKSLIESDNNHVIYSKKDLKTGTNRHAKAIIEAALRHRSTTTYGIWSVINEIVNLGGKVRIHNLDTQIVFTQNSLKEGLLNITPDKADDFIEQLVAKSNQASSMQTSPYRKFPISIAGVHIEIEIPKGETFKCTHG